MKFKGTIIITDPCYFDGNFNELIESYECDENLNKLGFSSYIINDTIWGDWRCKVYKLKKPLNNKYVEEMSEEGYEEYLYPDTLGTFTADAGLVSVFLLDEVLTFNPNFKELLSKKPWLATVIKDFDGDVEYKVIDDIAYLEGTGNINFVTI